MRIRESMVRVSLALLTPPLLAGMALLTWSVDAPTTVPVVFGIFAAFLAVIVIYDFPLAIELTPEGLERLCLLRRHLLPWSEVAAIIKPKRRGLIVVTRKRKKHVLIDRILEQPEREMLMNQGELHGVQVEL